MTLSAGVAVRDISPKKPMPLFGYPHVERVSTGVHDPLLASALWLQDGPASVVLVALDILQVEPPVARSIRRAVSAKTGTPEARVFVSCTHTHSGPVTTSFVAWKGDPALPSPDREYLGFVQSEVVAAAAEAKAASRPAEMAWTSADARGAGGNRLARDGVTDPEVAILAVRPKGKSELMAAALVYGMHPTVLHEDSSLVSSDFPYYVRMHLRERFGESLVVLYHTGPEGNQSPRYFVKAQTFSEAERLGRKVGGAAARSLSALGNSSFACAAELSGVLRAISLPRRRMPSVADAEKQLCEYRAEYDRLKAADAGHGPVRTAECAIFGAEGTVALARAQEQGLIDAVVREYGPIEMQAVRIGSVTIIGLPGEVFVEYSLAIKARSPRKVAVVCLVNGELQGYIVTPEAAAAGGYEATNSFFAPESGTIMVDTALALVKELG